MIKTINIKWLFLLTLLCAMLTDLQANAYNKLSIPDVVVGQGGTIALPVNLENDDPVVAMQFTLTVPDGFTVNVSTSRLTDRKADHAMRIKRTQGNDYLCMIYSPANTPLNGNRGTVLNISLTAPSRVTVGNAYPLLLKDAVASNAAMDDVLNDYSAGDITIAEGVDLVPASVVTDATNYLPGDYLVFSWNVENIGQISTTGGWSERLSLVDKDGNVCQVGTVSYDGTLTGGGSVSRQAEVVIPLLHGLGDEIVPQVTVVPDADCGERVEARSNNTTQGGAISMRDLLYLEVPQGNVPENTPQAIKCFLSRSGHWEKALQVNVACGDTRVIIPSLVTIPAGHSGVYFYITLEDNQIMDDDAQVVITAAAVGYEDVTATLNIEDNELPSLLVTSSVREVGEGESFAITLATDKAPQSDLTVDVACSIPTRFVYPKTVIIKAGELSALMQVEVLEDNTPDVDQEVTFAFAANGYRPDEAWITLHDNDVPDVELILTPSTVSEIAGSNAVIAKLRRLNHMDNSISFILSDDSNGLLKYSSSQVTMDAGVGEVTFAIGINDNDIVDGDRSVNVTAAIYIKSCSCQAQGGQAGSVTRQLTITDNDGPAITITSSHSTVAEGSETILTISRNANLNQELMVQLSSDNDTGLTYNHQVSIPVGEKSVMVRLSVDSNDQTDDGRIVSLQATADGYSTGSCWFLISNQTLPDAQISEFSLSATEAIIGQQVTATVNVTNTGSALMPSQLRTVVYMNDGSELCRMYTQTVLQPGETETMNKTFTVPKNIGAHEVYAVVNDGLMVQELMVSNNRSENIRLTIQSPFSTTLTTDKTVYQTGESIQFNGSVTGTDVGNVEVEIYFINDGYRQTLNATTDANGHFTASYTPFTAQMGHFIAGACYPGENVKNEMVAFDIVGLRRTTGGYLTCDVLLGEPYTVEIGVENPSHIDLHNVHVNILSQPDNYELSFDDIRVLSSNGIDVVTAHILGKELSARNEWEQARVEIISDEGARIETTLYLYCRNPQAQLKADIVTINTTMIKGQSRDYPFYISNIGKGSTGKITLSLPSWMTTATPVNMASLDQNESAQVVLRFTPTDDMQLNVPKTGTIAINCENGNGIAIPYRIEPVSETTGTLIVDVCDEYTYNTAAAPHVQGANVVVKHPTTGAVVAEGITDADGIFQATLPEGYYALYVKADKHDSYSNYILVDPGCETHKVVNISIQAIDFSFDVEPTEIEDVYDIVVNGNYETNVPSPVVVITGPTRIDGDAMVVGESQLLYFTLTNHGLIDALEVEFILPQANDEWSMRALDYTEPFTLGANQNVVIPVVITKLSNGTSPQLRWVDGQLAFEACMAAIAARYKHFCGTELKENASAYIMAMKACAHAAAMNDLLSLFPAMEGIGGPNTTIYLPTGSSNDKPSAEGEGEPIVIDKDKTICNPLMARCYDWLLQKLLELLKEQNQVYKRAMDMIELLNSLSAMATATMDKLYEPFRQLHELYEQLEKLRDLINDLNELLNCLHLTLPDFPELHIPNIFDLEQLLNNHNSKLLAKTSFSDYSTGIDYLDVFNDCFEAYCMQYINLGYALNEYLGDPIWFAEDDASIADFYEYLSNIGPEDFTYQNLLIHKPDCVSEQQLLVFVNHLKNSYGNIDVEQDHIDFDVLKSYCESFSLVEAQANEQGYETMYDKFEAAFDDFKAHMEEESNSVCASVSLQFSSRMVMTRQAFRGTLKVYNGNDSVAMQDVKLFLTVTDEDGKLATSHEFQVNLESLEGFDGEMELDAGWSLSAQDNGVATVLFIPTKYAAPTVDKAYTFAGTLSYIDPFVNELVTRALTPQTLTVKPSPDLELDYFLQRDVFGDDPLTEEIEPMIPSEFALLINNKGYGDASNVLITTAQPEITENNKGLSIDFSLLNGDRGDLGLDVINDFGTIEAKSQTYAQWWLLSSLTGHFTSYDASYTHLTSYDNPDLSLIDTLRVHELIHGFTAGMDGEKPLRGFLVNDMPDSNDQPDIIYFTNATQAPVAMGTATVGRMSDTEYMLTVTSSAPGWNYGNVLDPTAGKQNLVSVIRQHDGAVIYADNVWTTDRTLRDALDPLYENRLHFVVDMTGMTETYLITFEPRPDIELEVVSFGGLPTEGVILSEPLTSLTVNFNKPVQSATFTVDDIKLSCDGKPVDVSSVDITNLSDDSFELDLSSVTTFDGFYVLTVETTGILDQEGYNGSVGKEATWNQLAGGKILLTVSVEPEGCGTVLPQGGLFDYGTTLHINAVPVSGYAFLYWLQGDEIISHNAEFDFTMLANSHLTAVFQAIQCCVEIRYDLHKGNVVGATSQIYPMGTELELEAVPAEDYEFDLWCINGSLYGNNPILRVTIDGDMVIEALFKPVEEEMEVTAAPTIQTVVSLDEVIITAVGDGEVLLYIDGVKVDNPVSIAREGQDITIIITATAREEGKLISETTTLEFVVPKLEDVGVNSLFEDKAVAGIRYFNMMGQEMNEADGPTIVVVTYCDRSVRVAKVMK